MFNHFDTYCITTVSPLKTTRRLLYLKTQSVPRIRNTNKCTFYLHEYNLKSRLRHLHGAVHKNLKLNYNSLQH
jgi:hypothetical protein